MEDRRNDPHADILIRDRGCRNDFLAMTRRTVLEERKRDRMPEQRARGRGGDKTLFRDDAARARFDFGGDELASCPDGCLAVRRLKPDQGGTLGVDQGLAPGQRSAHEPAALAHELAEPEISRCHAAVQFAACTDRPIAERLRRKLRIREALGDGATFPLEIWGWRLGETLLLGTMAEAYSCIQQNVRSAFADREVVWLNLVNGSVGYLPPAPLYEVEIYQAWQTPFDRGSLELVKQAAIALGRDLLT